MAQSPDLVVPNAVQMTIFSSTNNATTNHINVLGAIKLGATTINQALANALAANCRTNWSTHLAPLMPPGTQYVTIGLRDCSAAQQTMYVGVTAVLPGTATGEQLPAGAAVCVSLKTALSGARHRGRVYISGWSETVNAANGVIDAAGVSAAAGFITAVQTSMAANGLTLAVISRPSYAQQVTHTTALPSGATDTQVRSMPARPGAVNAVTSITVRNAVWDSQRRRNAAGGGGSLFAQPLVMNYLDDTTGEWVTATRDGNHSN
jgi:hypothetical protein